MEKLIDHMTAALQIRKLSYGLGSDPHEVYKNIQMYYEIKAKAFHVDKYIQTI